MINRKVEMTPNTHLSPVKPDVVDERVASRPHRGPTCTIDIQQRCRDIVECVHDEIGREMINRKVEMTPNTHLSSAKPDVVDERVASRPHRRPTCTIDIQQYCRDVVECLHDE